MTATTEVTPHDRHLVGPDGEVKVVHVRGHRREVPAWLFETGPLPMLDRPSDAELPPLPDPETEPAGNVTVLHVVRCPHGSFPRYAAANCCRPAGSAAPDAPAVLSDAQPCTGTRANGDPCGQRTTYRFRDRPACHHHGGVRP